MTNKPKTHKAPAADTGLPAIDRRSLVCGFGTAAVAGVPALGSAAPMNDDPVFQAMAALKQMEIRYQEIETQKDATYAAVWDAEYEVMETKPATPAGAVALLRFVADLMEVLFPDDDEHEHYVGAVRNAADFFEGRSASA